MKLASASATPGAVLVRLSVLSALCTDAEDYPPTRSESFARLSPSWGVTVATDPHAHPAVKAFQFLIAT